MERRCPAQEAQGSTNTSRKKGVALIVYNVDVQLRNKIQSHNIIAASFGISRDWPRKVLPVLLTVLPPLNRIVQTSKLSFHDPSASSE